MKKIMFNDKYGLTAAVLEGRKTVARRVCSIQPPYKRSEIAFPVFAGDGKDSPLYGAFCWVNKDNPEEFTNWCRTRYKWDDIVAIAQCYNDIPNIYSLVSADEPPLKSAGWRNKMFVKAKYMPNRIKIKEVGLKRLQGISEEDCLKEGIMKTIHKSADGEWARYYWYHGVTKTNCPHGQYKEYDTATEAFANLINAICGKGTWERNPWVWRYEFELLKGGDNETD